MRASLVSVLLVAACTPANAPAPSPTPEVAPPLVPVASPPPAPLWPGGPNIPLRWMVDRPPWHAAHPIDWIVPAGTHAVVGSARGWSAIVDPATGVFSHERELALDGLVGVDGTIVALVPGDEHEMLTVLDATTLATLREVALPDNESESRSVPSIARVPSGPLVIALPGQPLALYDAKTFKRTRVLAKGDEWTNVIATASAVYASRPNPKYDEYDAAQADPRDPLLRTLAARISLQTLRRDETGRHPWATGPDATFQPEAIAGLGWMGNALFHEPIDTAMKLVDASNGYPDGDTAAFSENGDTIAVEDHGEVKLYSTTTGKLSASYPIAERNSFDDRPFPLRAMAFAGTTLYIAYEQELRVVELAKRTVSPAPLPPSRAVTQVLVSNDGEVETIGRIIGRFSRGARMATYPLRGTPMFVATSTVGVYGEYLYSTDYNVPSKLVTYREGKVVKEWPAKDFMHRAFVTSSGVPAVWGMDDTSTGAPPKTLDHRDGLLRILTWDPDVSFDADLDAKIAITGGALLDLTTRAWDPTVIDGPCKRWSNGYRLEQGGTRVASWHGDEVWLTDRTTKKRIGMAGVTYVLRSDRGSADRPVEVEFLRGTDDLVIYGFPGAVIWSPAKNELRVIPVDVRLATSPDGHTLALAFGDGRVALASYEAFRGAIAPDGYPTPRQSRCPREWP